MAYSECHKNRVIPIFFVLPDLKNQYFGVCILSACLRKAGYKNISIVSLYDDRFFNETFSGEHIFVFSLSSPLVERALLVARSIKGRSPQSLILLGGPHPTFHPEVIESPHVDAVCLGEGEIALPSFLSKVDIRNRILPKDCANWWVKDNDGGIHKNPVSDIINDFDALPFADYGLFQLKGFFKTKFKRFLISRGCPFSCSYCAAPSFRKLYDMGFKDYYRTYSPQRAVDEISASIKDSDCRVIGFNDSIFGLDKKWLSEFAGLYREKIGKPFYCHADIRMIDAEWADFVEQAGCRMALIGLETADDNVRKGYLNKAFTLADVLKKIKILRDRNIKIGLYNMIGIPGTDLDADFRTFELNKTLRPNNVKCQIFSIYPGTQIYEDASKDEDGFLVTKNAYCYAITEKRTAGELRRLKRLQSLFNMAVYLRMPTLILRFLTFLPLGHLYVFIFLFTIRVPFYLSFSRYIFRRSTHD